MARKFARKAFDAKDRLMQVVVQPVRNKQPNFYKAAPIKSVIPDQDASGQACYSLASAGSLIYINYAA